MQWKIGKVTVTKVVELEMAGGSRFLLPQATPDAVREIDWLVPHFADEAGRLRLSIHALIIETPERRILVDTCLGNDKQGRRIPHWNARQGTFLEDLAAAGYPAGSIDTVLCTHLHVDHVGWNTRLENGRWVPTFPRAKYVFGQQEYAYWEAEHAKTPNPVIEDSVLPIVAAGQAEMVRTDAALNDHVRLIPTPGHTPDHYAVELGKGETTGVLTGDLIHSPLQARYPELSMRADTDQAQSAVTRRKFLEHQCDTGRLLCTAHFPSPSTGHLTRWGDGFRFMPTSA